MQKARDFCFAPGQGSIHSKRAMVWWDVGGGKKVTCRPSWLRAAPKSAGRSAKSMLALWSAVCGQRAPFSPHVRRPLPRNSRASLATHRSDQPPDGRRAPQHGGHDHGQREGGGVHGRGRADGAEAASECWDEPSSAPSAPLRGPQGSRSPRLHGPATWGHGEARLEGRGAWRARGGLSEGVTPSLAGRPEEGEPGEGAREAGLPAPARFRSGQSGRGAGAGLPGLKDSQRLERRARP